MNKTNNSQLHTQKHSMAHIMAKAVLELFPKVKFGFGPSIENGFYYDFDFMGESLTNKDLKKIEKKMRQLINKDIAFNQFSLNYDEALNELKKSEQNYKIEQLDKLKKDGHQSFGFYESCGFTDLCEGPHVPHVKELKGIAFKLDRISGAYWLGSEQNPMLSRIYALCFETQEELDLYIKRREEAKEFDHKKLGKELDLFFIDDRIGKGLALWTPNGCVLREEIEKYAKEMEFKYGYKRVATPHISKAELFYQSGHLPAYEESMFPPLVVKENDEEKETFYLKPMNCPFHHIIYSHSKRSYKDLPLRLAEYGTCYRFEQSGELSGLLRVRSMTMNDAHIYVTEENLKDEIKNILSMYQEFYEQFELNNYYYRFSTRGEGNKDKFIGDPALWEKAEKLFEEVLIELEIPYEKGEGEAAFYGPKIDIQFQNLMGREETVSTIQIDFQGPLKFNLSYVNQNGEDKPPVIIHRAPLSTHERFVSFLIEFYRGAFPLWLAPTQIAIIPVSNAFSDACKKIEQELRQEFIRVNLDLSDNSLNKKIRTHTKMKVPHILVIGEKEIKEQTINLRIYGTKEQASYNKDEYIKTIKEMIKTRQFSPHP